MLDQGHEFVHPAIEKLLLERVKKIDVDARALQCTCTALYYNAQCPIHGPAYRRHIENRS
jgi:hypothetical protein